MAEMETPIFSRTEKNNTNMKFAAGGLVVGLGLGALAMSGVNHLQQGGIEAQFAQAAATLQSPVVAVNTAKSNFRRAPRTAAVRVNAAAQNYGFDVIEAASFEEEQQQQQQSTGYGAGAVFAGALALGAAGYAAKKKFTAAPVTATMEGSDFTPISETLNDKKLFSVTNGKEASAGSMMVWKPHGNKFFETFSYLPPLTEEQIAKQVQYLLNNGYTPCLEFEDAQHGYAERWTGLDFSVNAGYYDNRYWVMWKLPMYGCTNPDEVLSEVRECISAFPDCYIRLAGFDNIKQVQCTAMLVHRPGNDRSVSAVNDRQTNTAGPPPQQQQQQQNYSW